MLFDTKPKEKLGDFFNYKEELGMFVTYLTDASTRMVVINGLRRTGKSSLLRVGIKKAGVKAVLIDARELTSLSRKSFEFKLAEELKSVKGLPAKLLGKLESIDVGVKLSFKSDESLWEILKTLNPVIAIDEAQMLNGTGVDTFLAAVYDNTKCKIILTGSEIGVLDTLVGKDEPKAPLFGRTYSEIRMHPLPREKSAEFLALGFRECDKVIPEDVLNKALDRLDGIVGWLAMFGSLSISTKFDVALETAVDKGASLAYSELGSFLDMRPSAKRRYLSLLKILAEKDSSWADLKRALQVELKEEISDPQFSNYLNSLVSYGFLVTKEGVYSIPDPLLRQALRTIR
jgi:AAA+ ATPase superfamily predicted ATPase